MPLSRQPYLLAGIDKQDFEIHGVTNLVYANTLVRMSDVSEQDEVINNNTVSAKPTSEDYHKEVELDDNDKLEDEEADATGKVDDTYYNIGGQRVAVAKLAEYIKHKSKEDLLNEFEVST